MQQAFGTKLKFFLSRLDTWSVWEDDSIIRRLAEIMCFGSVKELGRSSAIDRVYLHNNFHVSIGMAPYKAFCGRKCQTSLCWYQDGVSIILGPKLLQQTIKKVNQIREKNEDDTE